MPKVRGPLLSLKARGTFGKAIIFTRAGDARVYFKPRNPDSPAQQAQRQWFLEEYVAGLTKEQADLLYSALVHLHDDYEEKIYKFVRSTAWGRVFGAVSALNLATVTMLGRQIRYIPVCLLEDVTITEARLVVATLGSGVTGAIAVYSNEKASGEDKPKDKLVEGSSIDMGSNGLKSSTFDFTFQKGVPYWVAVMNFHASTSVVLNAVVGGGAFQMGAINASLFATHVVETAGSGVFPSTAGSVVNNSSVSLFPALFY